MSESAPRIGIIAGELSGDILGAGLIREFKNRYPDAVFEGIAGNNMLSAGATTLFDMEELSVMGLVEVLSRIRRLRYIRKTVIQHFIHNPPDIFIGIDAPDFNLTVEKTLKEHGVKTVHYVSPTVWAWRENRIYKIAKATHQVLSIFPFEKDFYDSHKVPCRFVGHKMADDIPMEVDKKQYKEMFSLSVEDKVLALLPGSRGSEVSTLLHTFLQSAELLSQNIPFLKVVIPTANQARKEQIEAELEQGQYALDVTVVDGQAREVMYASDVVLLASGTATLEAMLCKRPMVAAYKLKPLTHFIMGFLYKAKYFTLPNILADKKLIDELLQDEVNPQHISDKLGELFKQDNHALIQQFNSIHHSLRQNADAQAAQAISDLLEG